MYNQTIAIVGAGIIGVTSAYLLSRLGHRIILMDAAEGPTQGASFANGAQLSYSYSDAMSSPSLLGKIPAILAGKDPAFRIKPSLDPDLVRWGSSFLSNARSHKEEFNTRTTLRLALHSRDVLHQVLEEHEIKFDYRRSGKLHIYTSENDLQKARIRVSQKSEWGVGQQILSKQQSLEVEPRLEQLSAPFAGCVYSPIDEVGNCPYFANALLQEMRDKNAIEERYKCEVHRLISSGGSVSGLETSQGRVDADSIVLATGSVRGHRLAKTAGIRLPIHPIKGYSITVPATDEAPDVCITDVDNKIVFARVGDLLRIAGCADIVGYDERLDPDRIRHLLNTSRKRFPKAGLYGEVLDQWTGFRPVTPSSTPIIGRTVLSNLYLNTGHGMLGWTLAMGSASLLASIIAELPAPIDSTGFRPVDHGIN
ncbi:D-amino acid dehydrogenase [uncultured Oceanisphaera sp.]|uniref:D-amino acid dehydrogenase n=1 Tax=uncultured Oceanisphaera sp. TaxID=353858 RepID=UPI00262E6CF5|nr:D-amino acid dehydrogenase [uncultured Oceanisphaera sp.]